MTLSERHLRELHEHSAIALDDIDARGYRTVTDPAELIALGFADYQARVPALLVPLHGTDGSNGRYALKPDHPRVDRRPGKPDRPIKYEYPVGAHHMLDVPTRCLPSLLDPGVPVMFSEGAKKADCGASLGYCMVNIWGTSAWYTNPEHGGFATIQAISDWQLLLETLDGRICYLAYDSDAWRNPNVARELRRLANWLTRQGALVFIVHLPDEPDGSKNGLDDFVARHGAEAFDELVNEAEAWGSVAMVRKLQAENRDLKRQLHALAQLRCDRTVDSTDLRVGWAIADELGWHRSKGQTGEVEINRDRIAKQSGLSADTAGKSIDRWTRVPGAALSKRVKWRDTPSGESHKVILLDTPGQPAAGAADVLTSLMGALPPKAAHGGKRVPRCPDHPDARFVGWMRDGRFDCGCVVPEAQVLLVEEEPTTEVKPHLAVLVEQDQPDLDANEPESKTATCSFSAAADSPAPDTRPIRITKKPQDAGLVVATCYWCARSEAAHAAEPSICAWGFDGSGP